MIVHASSKSSTYGTPVRCETRSAIRNADIRPAFAQMTFGRVRTHSFTVAFTAGLIQDIAMSGLVPPCLGCADQISHRTRFVHCQLARRSICSCPDFRIPGLIFSEFSETSKIENSARDHMPLTRMTSVSFGTIAREFGIIPLVLAWHSRDHCGIPAQLRAAAVRIVRSDKM